MAYELHADGTLTPLPKQNIDTGLGLERGAAILQDVMSVYETDGYRQIMDWIAAESGVAYGDSPAATKAHRILADHGRGMTFLVGDGVTPSNEGRGYVLRRIIRRAVQQAQRIGLHDVHRLSGVVVEQMGEAYPELAEHARGDRARPPARGGALPRDARARAQALRGARLGRARSPASRRSRSRRRTASRSSSRSSSPRSAARPSTSTATAIEMERHREVSRAGGSSELQRAADFARSADFTTEFVGYSKTDVLTQIGALEELDDGHFLAKLRESPFYPSGGGQVTDAGHDRARRRLRARWPSSSTRTASSDDQALLFRGVGLRRGRPRARARAVDRALPDDGEPHRRRTSCTRRCATCSASTSARRARPCGRTSSASTSRTTSALTRRGARRGRAARERARLREPAGARLRDADRRGAEARRDDALRREVRRHRPRRRGARATRSSCAAGRTSRRAPRSGRSCSSPRAPSAPACAGSRP